MSLVTQHNGPHLKDHYNQLYVNSRYFCFVFYRPAVVVPLRGLLRSWRGLREEQQEQEVLVEMEEEVKVSGALRRRRKPEEEKEERKPEWRQRGGWNSQQQSVIVRRASHGLRSRPPAPGELLSSLVQSGSVASWSAATAGPRATSSDEPRLSLCGENIQKREFSPPCCVSGLCSSFSNLPVIFIYLFISAFYGRGLMCHRPTGRKVLCLSLGFFFLRICKTSSLTNWFSLQSPAVLVLIFSNIFRRWCKVLGLWQSKELTLDSLKVCWTFFRSFAVVEMVSVKRRHSGSGTSGGSDVQKICDFFLAQLEVIESRVLLS